MSLSQLSQWHFPSGTDWAGRGLCTGTRLQTPCPWPWCSTWTGFNIKPCLCCCQSPNSQCLSQPRVTAQILSLPRNCQILDPVTSWVLSQPGSCHNLDPVTTWVLSNPGSCHVLETVKFWVLSHPRFFHVQDPVTCQILSQPGSCHIPGPVTSWILSHPGSCHIPDHWHHRSHSLTIFISV